METDRSRIRQATRSDTRRIWEFIERAYPETFRWMIPDRWEWLYLRNPRWWGGENLLPIWIAEKQGGIVGQIAAIAAEFIVGGRRVSGVWGVDLIVLPECRGEGLGRRLIEAVTEASPLYAAVEMSLTTKRIYDRLQYIPLNPIKVYFQAIHPDGGSISDLVAKAAGRRSWMKAFHRMLSALPFSYSAAAGVLRGALTVRRALCRRGGRPEGLRIEEVATFDSWLDPLMQRLEGEIGNHMRRDAAYFDWRYRQNPFMKYRIFAVSRESDIVGFSILRRSEPEEQNFGFLVDFLFPPAQPDVLAAILHHASEHFRGRVAFLQCSYPTGRHEEIFRRCGFFPVRESIPYAYAGEESLRSLLAGSRDRWHITRGDSDWDQIYPVVQGRTA